jgi:TPP-dependent 2-oxoacid decarboxylase
LSRVSMSEQRALAVATCGSTVLRELQFRLPPYPCRQYAGATSEPKTRQIVEGADLVLEGGVNLNDITINYGLRSRILAVAFANVGGYAPQDVAKGSTQARRSSL